MEMIDAMVKQRERDYVPPVQPAAQAKPWTARTPSGDKDVVELRRDPVEETLWYPADYGQEVKEELPPLGVNTPGGLVEPNVVGDSRAVVA